MHYKFNVATNQTGMFDYASVKLYLTDPISHFSIQMTRFQACIPSRFHCRFHIYSMWTKVSERFTRTHILRKILPFDSLSKMAVLYFKEKKKRKKITTFLKRKQSCTFLSKIKLICKNVSKYFYITLDSPYCSDSRGEGS